VEVIEQLGDTYTIKLPGGTIKMGIPSWSLMLFEVNALVTVDIKRNGQIVHCLAKILDISETGNPQAVVTLQDALLDPDNQPKQIDMLDLRGVQRINGEIVEHDMIPQGAAIRENNLTTR
jgi:predicted transcriptional regulator